MGNTGPPDDRFKRLKTARCASQNESCLRPYFTCKFEQHESRPIMSFFLSALGLMMVFEGIPYFCFPKKVKYFAEKLPEIPDSTLRVVGFFLMMMGLLVVYIGGGKND